MSTTAEGKFIYMILNSFKKFQKTFALLWYKVILGGREGQKATDKSYKFRYWKIKKVINFELCKTVNNLRHIFYVYSTTANTNNAFRYMHFEIN